MYNVLNSWPSGSANSLVVLFALGFLLLAPPSAGRSQAYGEHFVRLGETLPGAKALPAQGVARVGDRASYLQQTEELELLGGPYDDALAEPLAGLARQHRQRGDYSEALSTYRRALHVIRINDGLYSERQIPVLRELLMTFRETGDYESLDQRYEYFFRLYGSGKPPYTELRLRAALEYLRWQREALMRELKGDRRRRMLNLIALNGELLEAVMTDPVAPYTWKRDLTQSQMRNLYLLKDQFAPKLQEASLNSSQNTFSAKPLVEDLEDQKMDLALRGAVNKGRRLVQVLQQEAAGQGPVEQASLQLALADWFHWNGSRQRAGTAYREVISLLQEAGEQELLHLWMGLPVELPANGAFLRPANPAVDAPAVIRARFDVSAKGRVSNLNTEILSGEAASELNRFRRQLGGTLFRPGWEGGEPRSVTGLQRDYTLVY